MSSKIMDGMSKKDDSYEPIRLMEIDLAQARRNWLEKYGWKQRCNFVDSCWRWCKKIEGEMMMCTEAQAIKIELDFICEQDNG